MARTKGKVGKDPMLSFRVTNTLRRDLDEMTAEADVLELPRSRSAVAREALTIGLRSLRRKLYGLKLGVCSCGRKWKGERYCPACGAKFTRTPSVAAMFAAAMASR